MIRSVLLLFFIIPLISVAQSPDRFIGLYAPTPNIESESYTVAETSYGYLITGIIYDTINSQGYWAFGLKGIDFNGNELWQKKYVDISLSFYDSWFSNDYFKKSNGKYFTTLNLNEGNPNQIRSCLIKLNENGDTLWSKKYGGDSVDSVLITKNLSIDKDSGFLMTGVTYSYSSGDEKVILLKTDSLGNEIWRKKYNNSSAIEWGYSCIRDPNTNKIVLAGIIDNPIRSFVYIADSVGNLLSQHFFNGVNGGSLGNVKQLSDGNFVASGTNNTGNVLGGFDLVKSFVVKFDINGNLIWSKKYGNENLINDFTHVEVLPGDTIIAAGQIDTFFTQGLGLNSMYQLYKIAPNGDSLWRRYIDVISTNGTQDIFKGLTLTSDGGYAMTGFFNNAVTNPPFVLVKLDNWGCDTLGCQFVSVNENEFPKHDFTIYPNPSNGNIYIKSSLTDFSDIRIELVDFLGRRILTSELHSNQQSFDWSNQHSSIYLIRIFKNDVLIASSRINIVN